MEVGFVLSGLWGIKLSKVTGDTGLTRFRGLKLMERKQLKGH